MVVVHPTLGIKLVLGIAFLPRCCVCRVEGSEIGRLKIGNVFDMDRTSGRVAVSYARSRKENR